jgi:uncharacterized protein YdaU (DUF1376 family)
MSGKASFDLWIDDFLNGTRGLTNEECGAYTRLFVSMYDGDRGYLENDPEKLKWLLRCTRLQAAKLVARLVGLGKLQVDEQGLLRNVKVSQELGKKSDYLRSKFRAFSDQKVGKNSAKTEQKLSQNAAKKAMKSEGDPSHARTSHSHTLKRDKDLSNSTPSARDDDGSLYGALQRRLEQLKQEEPNDEPNRNEN